MAHEESRLDISADELRDHGWNFKMNNCDLGFLDTMRMEDGLRHKPGSAHYRPDAHSGPSFTIPWFQVHQAFDREI